MASEGYNNRVRWTGDYFGKNGTVSTEFIADVERRTNYFRAMCGLPANVTFNNDSAVVISSTDSYKPAASTLKSSAAQNAAVMIARNYNPSTGSAPGISHNPTPDLVGWSAAAWNANAKSNISFGVYGPGAVDSYMREEAGNGSVISPWNYQVGHRRWLIYPPASNFATGDQPGDPSGIPASNVIYVIQAKAEKRQLISGFVAYPPAGFFPAPLNSRYWSLSHTNADFSSAAVKMTDQSGKSVPIKATHQDSTYGDPAFVWEIEGAAASRSVADKAAYHVEVTGIAGDGVPSSLAYDVTLINPRVLGTKSTIKGPAEITAKTSAACTFPAAPADGSTRVEVSRKLPASWVETAESTATAMITANPSKTYPFVADLADYRLNGLLGGTRAFHITFPALFDPLSDGVPDQILGITRAILPETDAKLKFSLIRGYMTPTTRLVTEYSKDGGANWKTIGKAIPGISSGTFDATKLTRSIPLPKSSTPVFVRFRLTCDQGSPVYIHQAGFATGVFIDNIAVKNCSWLKPMRSNIIATGKKEFTLNASTAGATLVKGSTWVLRIGRKLGGAWYPAGPLKAIKVR